MAGESDSAPGPAPAGFEKFYKSHLLVALRTAMYAGATRQEAEDATSIAMMAILKKWTQIKSPPAYLRHAVVTALIKEKTRGLEPQRRFHFFNGLGTATAADDPGLQQWEDREWVMLLLKSLPEAQREVMCLIVDGHRPVDIAVLLGRTPDAVRQNLLTARRRLKQCPEINRVLNQREEAPS